METHTLFLPMLVLKGCEFSHKDMKNYKKCFTFIDSWERSTVWGLGIYEMNKILRTPALFLLLLEAKLYWREVDHVMVVI